MKILYIILNVLKFLFIITLVSIAIVPFLWVFINSFKSNSQILSSVAGFPDGLVIKNYWNAFKLAPFVIFYRNSVIVTVISTCLNVFILSMSAYVLARYRFKFNNALVLLFSVGLVIPGAALLQPLYKTLIATSLYNTLTGLIITYAAFGIPITLYIMMSYFKTIPESLEEAAYIDGASFLRTYFQIILPLSKPALATAAVLQFLLCWNEFQFALTLTKDVSKRTLPIALYYFKSAFASDYGAMFSAVILVTIPSIIFFIIMQKQVISGLVAGAIKS
ncbi:MAG: carbohydrate ABC transporter permease [Spirochaetales bacterium]|nr:carbohydrate ABC transporter permease [Spirochaetales bacterium]